MWWIPAVYVNVHYNCYYILSKSTKYPETLNSARGQGFGCHRDISGGAKNMTHTLAGDLRLFMIAPDTIIFCEFPNIVDLPQISPNGGKTKWPSTSIFFLNLWLG